MAKKLDLNECPQIKVFRQLVRFIENDPTIKRVVRPTSIRSWKGVPEDAQPFTVDIAPALRFTPMDGPQAFWSPGTMKGPLFVNVEVLVEGSDIADLLNLWWAIARAIYPGGYSPTNANVLALQAAGAYTGLVTFTQPAQDPAPDGVVLAGTGQLSIEVNNTVLAG